MNQTREGVSLEAQESKIRAYCALKDLELLEIVQDAGISGKNLNRPGSGAPLPLFFAGTCNGFHDRDIIIYDKDLCTTLVERVPLFRQTQTNSFQLGKVYCFENWIC